MSEISNEIIKKEVFKASIRRPLTFLPLGLSLLSVGGYFLNGGTVLLQWCIASGLGIGTFSFLYNVLLKKEKHSNNYLKKLEKEFLNKEKKQLRDLKRQLRSTKLEDDVKIFGEQAYEQLQKIQEKYQTYRKILDEKFSPGELTHRRYLGIGEEVYLLTLDHLKKISLSLETTNSIKTDSIEERLNILNKRDSLSKDEQLEWQTLNERIKIKMNQFQELAKMLIQNEKALTKLDETVVALSNINTNQGQSTRHIELALKNLEHLAKSATKYDIK